MKIQFYRCITIFPFIFLFHHQPSSASVRPIQKSEGKKIGWFPRNQKNKDEKGPNSTAFERRNNDQKKKKEGKKKKRKKDEKSEKDNNSHDKSPRNQTSGGIFGFRKRENSRQSSNTTTVTIEEKGIENINTTSAEKSSLNKTEPNSQNNTTSTPDTITKSRNFSPGNTNIMRQYPGGMIVLGLDESGGLSKRSRRANPRQPYPIGGAPFNEPPSTVASEVLKAIVIPCVGILAQNYFTKWFTREKIDALMKPKRHYIWERLNDRYNLDSEALKNVLALPPAGVSSQNWKYIIKRRKRDEKGNWKKKTKITDDLNIFNRTVLVLELSPSKYGLNVAHLQEIITFIISQHRNKVFGSSGAELEVVLLVNSPGGSATYYGLGAAQINRLSQEDGITTTVCVDMVAASGGYMIASQANKIVAAPFAYLGSIGVITEIINFNKALERYGVSPIVLTAGSSKAPLKQYGEVTKADKEVAKQDLNKMHTAFKNVVIEGRPVLAENIEEIANGDVFLGREAIALKLVDSLSTSEEYLLERVLAGDRVLKLHRYYPKFLRRTSDFFKSKGQLSDFLRNQKSFNSLLRLVQAAGFMQLLQRYLKA